MSASFSLHPNVLIPHDILDKPCKEHIEHALAAIQESGTKLNGDPCYSAHQAEQHFGILQSSLGSCSKGE
jgi:hypothetical protein